MHLTKAAKCTLQSMKVHKPLGMPFLKCFVQATRQFPQQIRKACSLRQSQTQVFADFAQRTVDEGKVHAHPRLNIQTQGKHQTAG